MLHENKKFSKKSQPIDADATRNWYSRSSQMHVCISYSYRLNFALKNDEANLHCGYSSTGFSTCSESWNTLIITFVICGSFTWWHSFHNEFLAKQEQWCKITALIRYRLWDLDSRGGDAANYIRVLKQGIQQNNKVNEYKTQGSSPRPSKYHQVC